MIGTLLKLSSLAISAVMFRWRMTRTKEKIKAIIFKDDGVAIDHTTERIGSVYKKKDGSEWAHYAKGYLQVVRDSQNVATLHIKPAHKTRHSS